MIKSNPMPTEWVIHQLENNSYQRSSLTVVKVLSPTSDFPAWGSDKGTGNSQGTWPRSPVGLIIGLPQDWGKQRLQTWRAHTNLAHTKSQRKGAVTPQEAAPNYLRVLDGLLWSVGQQGLTTGMGALAAAVQEGPLGISPLGGRYSVQFSRSVLCDSSRPHESQHARPPCPSPTPGVYSNSCPSSRWGHPATSSFVVPFSSCPQSLQASGSFPMSQLFTSGGQSIGVSSSASVLPVNTQDWPPLGWTGWISLQSKGLSRVFSNTTVQKHQFFGAQLSSLSNSHIHTWPLEKPYPWPDGPLLAK